MKKVVAKKTPGKQAPATKAKAAPAKPTKNIFAAIEPLPTDSWRLSTIDPKIASSEQAAQLLGLGYPRMFLTTPGDFTGTDDQLAALASNTRVIPRGALKRIFTISTFPDMIADELTHAVSQLVVYSGNHFGMYALECLYGTVETATAIVDKIASLPLEQWSEEGPENERFYNLGGMLITGLGFLLWRVPAKTRAALHARLEQVFKKVTSLGNYDPIAALDRLLHGRAGWERTHDDEPLRDLSSLLFITDDPGFVADKYLPKLQAQSARDWPMFDIQIGIVGGPKVMKALRESTAKFPGRLKKTMTAQLSLVK